MKDNAKGPGAGYIFQFEIALLELSALSPNEVISIEKIDDIGREDENGTYTLTVQAKHSICSTSKTFGNTSVDLWKTLNLWVEKVKLGILNDKNIFKAVTNVSIPSNSILKKIQEKNSEKIITLISEILEKQKIKRDAKFKKGEKAHSIVRIIGLIENVLKNKDSLKVILDNLEYEENYQVENDFYNKIHLGSIDNVERKKEIYHTFYGWIIQKSKEIWCNEKKEALFTKKDFEEKLLLILKNPRLINGIFRHKKYLEKSEKIDVRTDKNDIYIKQLADINRNEEFKEEIIKEAIVDFILCDIEITYHIVHNKTLTKKDFEDFEEKCFQKWKEVRRRHILKNVAEYSDEELNALSIKICDEILTEVKIDFQEFIPFDDTNKYVQNGTFLNLSNKPKIGWNPDWEKIYTQ